MNNRWKMNRIGFVNFWLYDEEIFELEDGKIFFRGGNGSGKSITTRSIISFLMDGDRSPERLVLLVERIERWSIIFWEMERKRMRLGMYF